MKPDPMVRAAQRGSPVENSRTGAHGVLVGWDPTRDFCTVFLGYLDSPVNHDWVPLKSFWAKGETRLEET
jgi:hypothetical protein